MGIPLFPFLLVATSFSIVPIPSARPFHFSADFDECEHTHLGDLSKEHSQEGGDRSHLSDRLAAVPLAVIPPGIDPIRYRKMAAVSSIYSLRILFPKRITGKSFRTSTLGKSRLLRLPFFDTDVDRSIPSVAPLGKLLPFRPMAVAVGRAYPSPKFAISPSFSHIYYRFELASDRVALPK